MTTSTARAGERRAWGWVAALRGGDTTPWASWTTEGDDSVQGGHYLPGAQQLELLRRINLAGSPDPGLVARVVTASAPGRGSPDLQLTGAAEHSPFGMRPVDPADLPDAELIRVASSLLAEDLVAQGVPKMPPDGRPRPWRTTYRLVGDQWLADPIRDELTRRGRPPGGKHPRILVLGTDLESLLVHAWTARCFEEGGFEWHEWIGDIAAHDRLPLRADILTHARRWRRRVDSDRPIDIVLDPAKLPTLVGVRSPLPVTPSPSADAVDLARRVAAPLGVLVLPDERSLLLRHTLLPRVAALRGPPLQVPAEHREWAHSRAVRLREALRRADYPVHGDLDALLPPGGSGASGGELTPGPTDAGVLDLATRLLLEGPTATTHHAANEAADDYKRGRGRR